MTSVAAPADRRFRRAHVKPVGRRHGWRRLMRPAARWTVVAAVAIGAVCGGASAAVRAHVLQIERIVVQGNERLSTGEVLALLNGLRGESLVWADLEAWRQQLLASSWVEGVTIRRWLPSTVEIGIRERRPIGAARIGGDLYLIDEHGTIIDQYGPDYADIDLPIIDGMAASEGGRGDGARAQLAARVIAAVQARSDVARRVSQIDVSELHDAAVVLSGDPAVIHLGEDQFLPRLQFYLELAPALRERVADIDSVDLRFGDRIVVRPAGRQDAAGASVSTGGRSTGGQREGRETR
jgi:cell division protein FtsQ